MMSLREPPGETGVVPHPRVGVGRRHPGGAGDAEGEAAHAGVWRLGPSPGPSPAETGGLGLSHQAQTQTGIWRLRSLLEVLEFYTRTGRFMTLDAWLGRVRIVFLC